MRVWVGPLNHDYDVECVVCVAFMGKNDQKKKKKKSCANANCDISFHSD